MLPALLAMIAGLAVCWLCAGHHAPQIQADILGRTRIALQQDRLATAGVAADGRDILLRGADGSPEVSDRARRLAENVWGVRTVRIETTPAPAAVPVPPPAVVSAVQTRLDDIVRLRNVQFLSGSAQLTADGTATLDQVAEALNKVQALTVSISGHTDSQGDPAANQALSEARAAAVKTYLISKGIAAERMVTAGFGQTRPVADNATPDGRRRNRRIEFAVTGGGKAQVEAAR